MKKRIFPILMMIFALLSIISCDSSLIELEEGNINYYIYPYVKFTLSADGKYYTATVLKGAKVQRITVPGFVHSDSGPIPVKEFAGFEDINDSVNLEELTLDVHVERIKEGALDKASNLKVIKTSGENESPKWAYLTVLYKENYHFEGWKAGDAFVYNGMPIDLEYKEAVPVWSKLVHVDAKEANCITVGNIEYWECSVCGKYFTDPYARTEVDDVLLPALGHNLGDWFVYIPATCTEAGEERRECSRCDYYESKIIPAAGHVSDGNIYGIDDPEQHWYHCNVDNVDYGFEPHTYGDWRETEKPGMSRERECSVCHHIDYTALPHIWHYVEPVAPDCTNSGNYGYWCCDLHTGEYTSDEAHEVIITWTDIFRPIAGHTMEHHPYSAETCRNDGNKEYWYCTVCHKYFSDSTGRTEIELSDTVIPHHTVDHFAAVAPTCTEEGNIEYWYCSKENRYFSDEACTNEITAADTVVPALGHDHTGDWVKTDATYHWKVCTRCNAIIDKAEHFYEITYDFNASSRYLVMTSVCECGRRLSSGSSSDTGAFDISTVFGDISVIRKSDNSWVLSADDTKVKYCTWTGEDGVTLLTGPEPFTVSCEISGSGRYKIFCHVQDRYGNETDIYFVEFTKYV